MRMLLRLLLFVTCISVQAQSVQLTIFVAANGKNAANTASQLFDTKGGTRTFTVELNTLGGKLDAPATYYWCNFASVDQAYADKIEQKLATVPGIIVYRNVDPYDTLKKRNLQVRTVGK